MLINFCQEAAMMQVNPIACDVALFVLLPVLCSESVRLFLMYRRDRNQIAVGKQTLIIYFLILSSRSLKCANKIMFTSNTMFCTNAIFQQRFLTFHKCFQHFHFFLQSLLNETGSVTIISE